VLNQLAPGANYLYRFYAANLATNTWAPASSQFSTVALQASNYGSRMKMFLGGYNRSETLADFPMLVNLSTNLPGFSYRQFASATGGDLRFTDSSGMAPIPFEIDEWNTNGTSSVWLNLPSLSGTRDFIWAYWGNPLATNLPASSTNGWAWPSFDLVWHLKESGFPYADSAQQFPAVSGVAPVLTNGIVGHGEGFNGNSDYLNAGPVNVGNTFTLSAWMKLIPTESNIQTIWANKPGDWNSAGFALYVNTYNTTDGKLILETGDGVNGADAESVTGVVTAGKWHFVAAAGNVAAGTAQLYVDGTNCTSAANIVTDFPNQTDLNLGRITNNAYYFNGSLDEARIQSGVQSANWIWANWVTVASNSILASYSAVTQQPPVLTLGGDTSLSWVGSGLGFALYTTTNLAAPATWSLATNKPLFTNNHWQVALASANNGSRFYRFKSQRI
jgi:hypothetical protein